MKRYAVVIEKAAKNFGAYVPDLPGCVATGPTVEKTEQLLREAIALHIQGIIEDGLTIPEPSSVVEYVELEASNSHASEERVEIVNAGLEARDDERALWEEIDKIAPSNEMLIAYAESMRKPPQ